MNISEERAAQNGQRVNDIDAKLVNLGFVFMRRYEDRNEGRPQRVHYYYSRPTDGLCLMVVLTLGPTANGTGQAADQINIFVEVSTSNDWDEYLGAFETAVTVTYCQKGLK